MIIPVIFLVAGVILGKFLFPSGAPDSLDLWITVSLSVVIVMAGMDIGAKKLILRKLAEYRAKVLLIPFGIVIGSISGGLLLGIALRMPLNEAAAISAGFAYYSLSAGILTNLGGAELGALAFIANVFRELLSFLLIPILAKRLNPYCAVAPGGATTMDTTLGVISRCTSEEITVMAMLNGVILSMLVPILVPFLYGL